MDNENISSEARHDSDQSHDHGKACSRIFIDVLRVSQHNLCKVFRLSLKCIYHCKDVIDYSLQDIYSQTSILLHSHRQ